MEIEASSEGRGSVATPARLGDVCAGGLRKAAQSMDHGRGRFGDAVVD